MSIMEASLPDETLKQLASQLYRRHLIVSIPALLLIIISLLVIPLIVQINAMKTNIVSNPQFTLGQQVHLYYNRTVQYVQSIGQMAQLLWNLGSNFTSSTDNSNIIGNQGSYSYQMYCLFGSSCNKFAALSSFIWQRSQIDNINTIERIVIYSKTNSTCASMDSNDALTNQQFSLLSQSFNTTQVVSMNNKIYIIEQTVSLTIMSVLLPFQTAIPQLIEQYETTFIQYYSIKLLYPFDYGVFSIQKGVKSKQLLQQQITIDLTDGTTVVQFLVQYSKIPTHRQPTWIVFIIAATTVIFYVVSIQRKSVQRWINSNFNRKQLVNKLYKYTIRDVFMSKNPPISNTLQRGPCCELMKTLSQLMDNSITPILLEKPCPTPKQPFKFVPVVSDIIDRYKQQIKSIMVSKSNYVLANRFNIQTHVNDMCEEQMRVIKGLYARADRLGIQREFFKFAYLALLKGVDQYDNFVKQDDTPLPNKLLDYFLEINRKIHKVQYIWEKINIFPQEEDSPPTPSQYVDQMNCRSAEQQQRIEQNKQELQFRIRVFLNPKCMAIIQELDSKDNYAKELGLEKELSSLGDIIQNTRHMLTRHNKSIRCFCK